MKKVLLLLTALLLLGSGCAEFRRTFSRSSHKKETKKERRAEKKRSPYRHPMDELIFGNTQRRQDFAGGLNETERREWEKFTRSSGSDAFFDGSVNAVHESMRERKKQNERWVYSPRPSDQDVTRER